MREKAVLLGKTKSLVGIITNPEVKTDGKKVERPAVVLLNSGTLHRVGPNRVYVKLARKLAADGFLVLRFDLSGIGDSQLPGSAASEGDARFISDTREAMDFLSDVHGVNKFILMGICSGADNAFSVACIDERVVGVNMIEPFSFPTTGYFAQSYSHSFLKLRSWKRLLTGQSEVWGIIKGLFVYHTSKETRQLTENWELPPKEKLISDLRALLQRGLNLCFIYVADGCGHYNYSKLLESEVSGLTIQGNPRFEFLEGSDHLFTLLEHQTWLTTVIHDWITKAVFGAPQKQIHEEVI